MKEKITVRPAYIHGGWMLYLRPPRGSASARGYWGGTPQSSPDEAIRLYGPRIVEALPGFEIAIMPATRAQLNRAPELASGG